MGVKINPNQVSQENLLNNPIGQPSRVAPTQVPGSGSQPVAPQTLKAPDIKGFDKFKTGGMKIPGVFGHAPAGRAGAAHRITQVAGPALPVGEAIARVAEGLDNFGEGPLAPKDLMILNGALGILQHP